MAVDGPGFSQNLADMFASIFSGWNLRRFLYLLMGLFIMAEAAWDRQWTLMIPGAWFALMAIFSLGCASGNCSTEPGRQAGRR
jgi:hypothetical protein